LATVLRSTEGVFLRPNLNTSNREKTRSMLGGGVESLIMYCNDDDCDKISVQDCSTLYSKLIAKNLPLHFLDTSFVEGKFQDEKENILLVSANKFPLSAMGFCRIRKKVIEKIQQFY
jgi:hypothetical protein